MISKEQLFSIPELNLAGIVEKMTDMQLNAYVQSLNLFVDRIPSLAESLRNSLAIKAYSAVGMHLNNTANTLDKLYADKLAAQCRKPVSKLNGPAQGIDHDEVEAIVENLILSISSMSIEIQMAGHKVKAAPRPSAAAQAPARSSGSSGRPSILAVDNAVMFLNTLTKMLSDAPYDLHCITTCSEALSYLQSNKPDMFLLDIEMPEMDGYELARRIKSSGQRAPILFITANSAREYVDKAVEVGAAGLLMKPLRINQLLAKLKEFI